MKSQFFILLETTILLLTLLYLSNFLYIQPENNFKGGIIEDIYSSLISLNYLEDPDILGSLCQNTIQILSNYSDNYTIMFCVNDTCEYCYGIPSEYKLGLEKIYIKNGTVYKFIIYLR